MSSDLKDVGAGLVRAVTDDLGESLGYAGEQAEEVRAELRELVRLQGEATLMRIAGLDTTVIDTALQGVNSSLTSKGAASAARLVRGATFTVIRRTFEAATFLI